MTQEHIGSLGKLFQTMPPQLLSVIGEQVVYDHNVSNLSNRLYKRGIKGTGFLERRIRT